MEITFDEWEEKYIPILNPNSPNSFDFGMYGADLEFIKSVNVHRLWTVKDDNDGTGLYIVNGYWIVDALSHFVTENSWNETIIVRW